MTTHDPSPQPKVIAALYEFRLLQDPQWYVTTLKSFCQDHGIRGSLLIAHEGINGTVSGDRSAIDALQATLHTMGFHRLNYKESHHPQRPFKRLKVCLKKEIVTMGIPSIDPQQTVGTYVEAKDWNQLIQDPDVCVIDTRNTYEYDIGTFAGAENPETATFRSFPLYVDQNKERFKNKKLALFCTGGIRCEKATSYMLAQGFKDVYHLKGGILKYLEEVPQEDSLWKGVCFVFDDRIAVDHTLTAGSHDMCFGCRNPITPQDRSSPLFEEGVTCPRCHDQKTEKSLRRCRERQRQHQQAKNHAPT